MACFAFSSFPPKSLFGQNHPRKVLELKCFSLENNAGIKNSFVKSCYTKFWISLACLFGELDISVICHVFVRFRLISIARYVIKSPSICFEDKLRNLTWTCCLLAFYTVTPGPVVWSEVFASTVCDCYHGYHICHHRRCRGLTSRKLYVCLSSSYMFFTSIWSSLCR